MATKNIPKMNKYVNINTYIVLIILSVQLHRLGEYRIISFCILIENNLSIKILGFSELFHTQIDFFTRSRFIPTPAL